MIEYQGIYKAFDTPVLSGVDLRVERGETLSIIGPSGTGKSVLLKTTLALVVPDRGDVLVFSCSGAPFQLGREKLEAEIGPRLLTLVGNVRSALAAG